METVLFFAVAFAAIRMLSASSIPYSCDQGEFYNRDKMDCVKCSDCPDNQFLLRACWKDQDTVCGSIGKFEFRQLPYSSLQQPVVSENDLQPVTDKAGQLPVQQQITVKDVSGDSWYTLTLVLAALLVFLCIFGMILIFITCYIRRKTNREMKCDSVFTSSLLKADEQTGMRQIEHLKLVTVT